MLEFSWCPVDRIEEAKQLFHLFKPEHILSRDEALLRWQHRFMGRDDLLSLVVAQHEGRLVGMMGLIQCELTRFGERLPMGSPAIWIIEHEFRGQGLGLPLMEFPRTNGFPILLCMGANERSDSIIAKMDVRTWSHLPRFWARTDAASQSQSPTSVEWDAWDSYWVDHAKDYVGLTKDAAYLRWRYADHPRYNYSIHHFRSAHRQAIVVTRPEDTAPILRVLETVGDSELIMQGLRWVREEGWRIGFETVDLYSTSDRVAAAAVQAGFGQLEPEPPTHFQPLLTNPRIVRIAIMPGSLFEGHDCEFGRGDSDQDRPNV